MPIVLDLNGNLVEQIEESGTLQERAEQCIIDIVHKLQLDLEKQKKRYYNYEELSSAISASIDSSIELLNNLIQIVKDGAIVTEYLGITSEEDYTELRNLLLKEMMRSLQQKKG